MSKSEWISVQDQKPEELESIAGLNNNWDARYAGHFEGNTFFSDETGHSLFITHWQPLPPPPTED